LPKNKRKKKASTKVASEVRVKASQQKEEYLLTLSRAPTIDASNYWLQMLPIWLFTAVVILLVHMTVYEPFSINEYWSGAKLSGVEFFSYCKFELMVVCLWLALIILIYRLCVQSLSIIKTKIYIPILVYLVFVLLSFAFSQYHAIAWRGFNERFEGTLSILCYMVLLLYVINTLRTERDFKWIIYPLAVSAVILSLIGVSQYLDMDFFKTTLGQKIISFTKYWPDIDKAAANGEPYWKFTMPPKMIYQTVYNPNYVGFYLTLLLPLWLMMVVNAKKILLKIVWGILFGLTLFNLIGSASSAGLIGLVVELIVAVVIFNKKLLAWWRSLALCVGIAIITLTLTFGTWLPEAQSVLRNVIGITVSEVSAADETAAPDAVAEPIPPTKPRIEYLVTDKLNLEFEINGVAGVIKMVEDINAPSGKFIPEAISSSGGVLELIYDNDTEQYSFNQTAVPELANISIAVYDNGEQSMFSLEFAYDSSKWEFVIEKGEIRFLNPMGNTVQLKKTDRTKLFDGHEDFASNRGYIWSRSIPLLKKTIFIGRGADTYIMYFPHNDYVGKYNAGFTQSMIVDKPHSMYLDMGVNTGVISTLAWIAMLAMYLASAVRLYWRRLPDDFISFVGAGLFVGIAGFAVAGISNDTTVSTMPLFYGLLGTGIISNIIVRRNRNLES
jgi:hypothetical protein